MNKYCSKIHVEEMTLHNNGSSAGFNIPLKREREKKRKRSYQKVFVIGPEGGPDGVQIGVSTLCTVSMYSASGTPP